MNVKVFIEKSTLLLLLLFNAFMYINGIFHTTLWAYITLALSLYTLFKFKNNIALFFIFFCIFYFEYSFMISRYISNTPILDVLFKQIKYDSTNFIGISGILLFHIGILLFSPKQSNVSSVSEILFTTDSKKKNKVSTVSFILTIIIALFIINYQIVQIIPLPRTIYEYLIIFFVLAFYYSKNEKVISKILFFLMLINIAIDFYQGGRVIVLQPILAYMCVYFLKYLSIKRITIVAIIGLVFFTTLGVYGDYMANGYSPVESLKYVSPKDMVRIISKRKLALDTSVSSYWTGLTFVEMSNKNNNQARLSDFREYMTSYTLLGQKSGYTQLHEKSLKYYIHYNGGMLPSYMFYWLGYIGLILLGCIFGLLLKYFSKLNQNSSEFGKIFFIYFISTMPRWFLYFPTPLIRGTILIFIVYLITNFFVTTKNRRERNYE